RGDAHERKIPRRALHRLVILLHASARLGRYRNRGHELARRENRLVIHPLAWQHVELGDRHRAATADRRELDARVERRQRHRRIGWMHDVARPAVENREILILAMRGRTARSAVLETRNVLT